VLILLIAPVQVALAVLATHAFTQAWNVEVDVPETPVAGST
jgi:hypothetical protein